MSKERIAVYSAITGNYDNVNEVIKEEGIDYYLFTNNKKIKSKTWEVVYIEDDKLSNVKLARRTKILGHPILDSYDILVWMDGAVSFDKKIKDFIDYYLSEDDVFVAFKHGERNSICEEAVACLRYKKETKENIKKVLDFYNKEGYKDDNGLIESTVYIKRHKDPKVKETMKLWFDMILDYTKRDQLSFNYCIYKTGLKVKWINEKVFDNDWFTWVNHNDSEKIENYRVYFGDMSDYDPDLDVQDKYKIDNDTYSFRVKVPKSTSSTIIEVCNTPYVRFDNLEIKGIDKQDIEIYNYINYNDNSIFYNKDAVLKINKELNEGDVIDFKVNLKKLNDSQRDELIEYLCINKLEREKFISDLENRISELGEEINNIYDSKSWKITEPLRKITGRRK